MSCIQQITYTYFGCERITMLRLFSTFITVYCIVLYNVFLAKRVTVYYGVSPDRYN